MEQDLSNILLEFALLFIVVSITSLLFKRLRLPVILAPVLFGVFLRYTPLAPYLEMEDFKEALNILANFGVLFLLFYIGLQIDFKELKRFGKPILKLTALSIIIPFIFGFLLIIGLGYGTMVALVIGMTRIPVAEAVVVPILDEFGLIKTKVGQFIIGPGVLDDVIEVVLVAIVSIWIAENAGTATAGNSDSSLISISGNVLLFSAAIFTGYKYVIPFLGKYIADSPRTAMIFCVAILLLYSGLAEQSKLGLVIGALTSGIAVRPWLASLEENIRDSLINAVQIVAYGFFGVFFFYQVGLMVELESILQNPILIIMLFAATTVGKLLSALLMIPDGTLTKKEAITVGIGLDVQMTTELIIAQMLFTAGLIDSALYAAIIGASSLMMIFVPTMLVMLIRKWKNELITSHQ